MATSQTAPAAVRPKSSNVALYPLTDILHALREAGLTARSASARHLSPTADDVRALLKEGFTLGQAIGHLLSSLPHGERHYFGLARLIQTGW